MDSTAVRRLSAIVFADIAGYTALMQQDERHAVRSRNRFRDALSEAMRTRRGEAVQHYGDGTLSIFESAVEAAESAAEVQRALRQESTVPLRIGIHIGDIVRDAEGVYGDGVNVAARIQSLATPGSVLMSDRVSEEISNHPALPTRFLGNHDLKNVMRPVGVHALELEGLVVPSQTDLWHSRRADAIAVLPFLNHGSTPDSEHFSDGITEEVINVLARIQGLKVTSRTSSFSFKGTSQDIRTIADALDVEHVLEGSVRIAGDRVRVRAQLIDSKTGYHVFSETYDRALKDVFQIQDEIAEAIANSLKKSLNVAPTIVGKGKSTDVAAYTLYLKGRHYWNQWSPEGALRAISLYREAIKRAPDYGKPYAGLATAYCFLGALGRLPADEAYREAKESGTKAAQLDPGLAEAHLALGLAALFSDWDATESRRHFEVARGLNPGLAEIRHYFGLHHMIMGNPSGALTELRLAQEMDPLSLPINNQLADALSFSRQYDDALHQYHKTLELAPTFRAALEGMGWVYAGRGEYEKAIETFERYAALSPTQFAGSSQLGFTYGLMGDFTRAIEYQQRLEERERADPTTNLDHDFAIVYLGLGKLEWAFSRLERAVEQRVGGVIFLGASPVWSPVADHPRFRAILDRIGLWSQ